MAGHRDKSSSKGGGGTRTAGLRNTAYSKAYQVQTNVVAKSTENIQFEGAYEYNLHYLVLHLAPFSMTGVGYVLFHSESKLKAYVIYHSETKW